MYDVAIIGSGCAGLTAAIYTSRALLSTVVIAGTPGGQLATTSEVENFPGFVDGIGGFELLSNMQKQAMRFGTKMEPLSVTSVILTPPWLGKNPINIINNSQDPSSTSQDDSKRNTFLINTTGERIEARSVIIATGASAKTLGIPSEDAFRGKGISYCATCDGFFFRNKHVAVFGGGDTAMEEATFMTKFASHVTLIHRRDQFRASRIMIEKAKNNPKITILTNKSPQEFYGTEGLRGVKLIDTVTQEVSDLPIDGAFVAIGHTPATKFLSEFVALDEMGYVSLGSDTKELIDDGVKTKTSVPGVFAAGDCTDHRYRQGIVAAGMGAQAAIDVERYLDR